MTWRPTKERPVSWSAKSSFDWDADEWHEKYVVHAKCTRDKDGLLGFCAVRGFNYRGCPAVQTSPQMLFGNMVGDRYATDPTYLPKLPRFEVFEHPYLCTYKKIPLIGFADGWNPSELHLGELKTGVKPWDQKRADQHGQITMYCLMAYLMEGIKPESIRITLMWLPTRLQGNKVSFVPRTDPVFIETKRTMTQVLEFGTNLVKTVESMKEFADVRS